LHIVILSAWAHAEPSLPAILDNLPRLLDNFAQRGLRPISLNSAMP
jgi:hypothetical protein